MAILSSFILFVPTLYEIITDRAEWKKNIRDKKGQDVIIRGLIMILVSLINCLFVNKDVTFWQSFILSFGYFVMFFDPVMGIILKQNPFFLGTTSKTDKILKFVPWYVQLLLRGTVFAISILVYTKLDIIKQLTLRLAT